MNFQKTLHTLPPLAFLSNTDFWGSLPVSRSHKYFRTCWSSHIDTVQKKAQQRLCFLQHLKKYKTTQRSIWSSFKLKLLIQSRVRPSLCGFAHLQSMSGTDWNKLLGQERELSRLTFLFIQNLYRSRVRKWPLKSPRGPHILDKHVLDFYLQVSATERYLQKPAGTKTISCPRLSLL